MLKGCDIYHGLWAFEGRKMAGPHKTYRIDSNYLKNELDIMQISMRNLGDPKSINYIGLCDKTIRRAIQEGRCSLRTAVALSKIVDIDKLLIDNDNPLVYENVILRKKFLELQKSYEELQNTLMMYKKEIKPIIYTKGVLDLLEMKDS